MTGTIVLYPVRGQGYALAISFRSVSKPSIGSQTREGCRSTDRAQAIESGTFLERSVIPAELQEHGSRPGD